MKSSLILMFTHNDVTTEDAIERFEEVKDLNIDYYGFKEIGLSLDKMKKLCDSIHSIGKKAFLEVVEYEENKTSGPAKIAVDIGFDYLMGTIYYPSIWDIIDKSIKYMPFCGKVYGRPSVLDGTIAEVVDDAKRIEKEGVDGFDILAYRYKYKDKINDLIDSLKRATSVPIVSAGSINSFKRLDETISQKIWAFTIGGAFYEKKFVPAGNYRDNVAAVLKRLGKI